ncbi:oxidoreductase-like domain-containing protein [Paraburkholderia fungorum]|uniref:oxidoreductase-like domain-containing protein n=1 Tax=Paraburkholderia fungorum TaxID=134537 RepID=UPI0038B97BAD
MPRVTPKDDPPPAPPVQPDLDDCCHSGCNPCVFDLYDEALERYQAALAEWQARQAALKVRKARMMTTAPAMHAQPTKPRTRR